jgi:hypothetical protein
MNNQLAISQIFTVQLEVRVQTLENPLSPTFPRNSLMIVSSLTPHSQETTEAEETLQKLIVVEILMEVINSHLKVIYLQV